MKNFNKIALFLAMLPLGLQASNLGLPTLNDKVTLEISKQDEAIVKVILSMKEAVDANLQAQKQIDAANGMFGYNKKPLASDAMNQLVMAMNQYKASFARLLDKYLAQFGQLYEKKAGLLGAYRNVLHISSKNDQAQPITLNEHALFISELQRAAQQSDWGTTVTVELPLQRQNQTMVQLLNLDQIISAISQVPLPSNYSATAIVAGVAATGAIAAAGYFAYQAMNQPASDAGKRTTVSAAVLRYEQENNIDITGQSLDQRTKNFIEQNNNKSAQRTSAQDLGFNNPTENVESAKAPELLDPSSIYSIKKPNSGIGDDEFKLSSKYINENNALIPLLNSAANTINDLANKAGQNITAGKIKAQLRDTTYVPNDLLTWAQKNRPDLLESGKRKLIQPAFYEAKIKNMAIVHGPEILKDYVAQPLVEADIQAKLQSLKTNINENTLPQIGEFIRTLGDGQVKQAAQNAFDKAMSTPEAQRKLAQGNLDRQFIEKVIIQLSQIIMNAPNTPYAQQQLAQGAAISKNLLAPIGQFIRTSGDGQVVSAVNNSLNRAADTQNAGDATVANVNGQIGAAISKNLLAPTGQFIRTLGDGQVGAAVGQAFGNSAANYPYDLIMG